MKKLGLVSMLVIGVGFLNAPGFAEPAQVRSDVMPDNGSNGDVQWEEPSAYGHQNQNSSGSESGAWKLGNPTPLPADPPKVDSKPTNSTSSPLWPNPRAEIWGPWPDPYHPPNWADTGHGEPYPSHYLGPTEMDDLNMDSIIDAIMKHLDAVWGPDGSPTNYPQSTDPEG